MMEQTRVKTTGAARRFAVRLSFFLLAVAPAVAWPGLGTFVLSMALLWLLSGLFEDRGELTPAQVQRARRLHRLRRIGRKRLPPARRAELEELEDVGWLLEPHQREARRRLELHAKGQRDGWLASRAVLMSVGGVGRVEDLDEAGAARVVDALDRGVSVGEPANRAADVVEGVGALVLLCAVGAVLLRFI